MTDLVQEPPKAYFPKENPIDAILWIGTIIDSATALVYARIYKYVSVHGICSMSIQAIAAELNLEHETVCRSINKLQLAGYIENITPLDRIYGPKQDFRVFVPVDKAIVLPAA